MLEDTLKNTNGITNINNILYNTSKLDKIHEKHIHNLIDVIENKHDLAFGSLRDLLYNLLIYNIDIYVFIFLLNYFIIITN